MESSPTFQWPAGHRSALSLVVHVPGTGLSDESTSNPDLVGLDYTVTGCHHLLTMLADVDVKATFAFTAEAVQTAPQLVRLAAEQGHEIAASACSPAGSTEDAIESLYDLTNARINGLIEQLPGFQASDYTDAWGNDSGRAWHISGMSGDYPVLAPDSDAVRMPVSPYLIDSVWLSPARPLPQSSLLEAWSLALAAHRTDGSFMPVVVHPHIMGRPGFLGTLTRFLDESIASGDVWITRLDHIAATWHEYKPEIQG